MSRAARKPRTTSRFAAKIARRSSTCAWSVHAATAAAWTKSGEAVPMLGRSVRNRPITSASPTIAAARYPVMPERLDSDTNARTPVGSTVPSGSAIASSTDGAGSSNQISW